MDLYLGHGLEGVAVGSQRTMDRSGILQNGLTHGAITRLAPGSYCTMLWYSMDTTSYSQDLLEWWSRAASGYVGKTGDCVARSIAIVMDLPYHKVYSDLSWINATMP